MNYKYFSVFGDSKGIDLITIFLIGGCIYLVEGILLFQIPVGDFSVLACGNHGIGVGDHIKWVDGYIKSITAHTLYLSKNAFFGSQIPLW